MFYIIWALHFRLNISTYYFHLLVKGKGVFFILLKNKMGEIEKKKKFQM